MHGRPTRLGWLVAALTIAACSRDVPPADEVSADPAVSNRPGIWQRGDFAAAVDSIMADYAVPDGPGAAVLVARDGEPLVLKGYGLAEVETGRRVTATTNFRLASVTKQFNATTILILRREGLLSLDDPIGRYLPELPAFARGVTVQQLLRHVSGLPDYEDYLRVTHLVPVREYDVPFMIADAESLRTPPGTAYHYSNTGYALLGLIAERAAALPFQELLRTSIFAPAGMNGSIAYVDGGPPVSERAFGYSRAKVFRTWKRTDQSMTSAVLGDGGIYSSVHDLLQWERALNTHLLLDSLTQEEAFVQGMLADGTLIEYGYGWRIGSYRGHRTVAHSGGTMGFTHHMLRFPDDRFTVAILTNRDQTTVVPLVTRIVDLYLVCALPSPRPSGRTTAGAAELPDAAGPLMSNPDIAHPHPRQGSIAIRGCTLVYREMGEGVPVVFIHGTLAGMDTFRRQLLWFGGRARAMAYSRRFHLPSGPEHPEGPYALDDHAADLIGLVRELRLQRPHLVGSSYGAYVALRACLMEPSLAASLVAAEPPMLRLLEQSDEGRAAFMAFHDTGLAPAREAFGRGDIEGGAASFFDGVRGEHGAFARLTNLQRADLVRFGPEVMRELSTDLDLYMPPISLKEAGTLNVPALLLSGERSPRLFHIITNALHGAIPGSRLMAIPAADHSIHTSAPAAYSEAVWEFVSAHV